jgi:hypothetical protein
MSLGVITAADKYSSEYPLPGGVEQYFETLVRMLRYVREAQRTPEDLSRWLSETFQTYGEIAVNGYVATVSRMGLWAEQDGVLRLTPDGVALAQAADAGSDQAQLQVMHVKLRVFAGYDVLLDLLRPGPRTLDEIRGRLTEALGVGWKSNNQAMFRVNWLRSLGLAAKDGLGYRLTDRGMAFADSVAPPPPRPVPDPTTPEPAIPVPDRSPLGAEAVRISDWLDRAAVAGGDGKDFEAACEAAFRFLGFDTQLISGAGNPDVLATAAMGDRTYRVLIDAKSRASGTVQQNDVNTNALGKQRAQAGADYAAVVGREFAGGNLAEFCAKDGVRLLRTAELRDVLVAHAEAAIPPDDLRPLFGGGGPTDESALAKALEPAEARANAMRLAGVVYAAVRQHQHEEGVLTPDSLFYVLGREYPVRAIRLAVEFLKADFIGGLGETDRGGLHTRLAPRALTARLAQLGQALDLPGK